MSIPSMLKNLLPGPKKTKSLRRAGNPGRTEKFMGNAQRVAPEALSGPPLAPKAKKPVGRYLLGGTALGGALAYGVTKDDTAGGTKTPVSTSTAPGGSIPATIAKPAPRSSGSPKSTKAATPVQAPSPSKPPRATGGGSSASKKGTSGSRSMRGSELADYLGLSADSAVRRNLRSKAGEAVSPKQESPLKAKAQAYRRKMSKG